MRKTQFTLGYKGWKITPIMTLLLLMGSMLYSQGNRKPRVTLCHNGNTRMVPLRTVANHLNHGDFLGPCDECIDPAAIDPDAICFLIFNPVCGCNGVTYSNPCFAENAGVLSWAPGPCDPNCIDVSLVNPQAFCPLYFDPVCGCDGKTYSNSCFATIQGGVTSWTMGPCNGPSPPAPCIDPSLIDPNGICPAIFAPVCGCDGNTYSNSCVAQTQAGVTSWTNGACSGNLKTGPNSYKDQLSLQISPNPAVDNALITFTIPKTGPVAIELYSVDGKQIAIPYEGIAESSKVNEVRLPLEGIGSGFYFVKIKSSGLSETRKLIISKD